MLATLQAQFEGEIQAAENRADGSDDCAGAWERLRALGGAYVRWGLAHTGPYRLLVENDVQLLPVVSSALLARVGELLDEIVIAGHGRTPQGIWCALHGLVSLHAHLPGHQWGDLGALVDELLAPLRDQQAAPFVSPGEDVSVSDG